MHVYLDENGEPITQRGLLVPGNIDLGNRPRVRNPDGSISTVRSIGVNIDGREYLIPTVSDDGRLLSNDEAIAEFQRTGKHLGAFDTPANATAYAQKVHQDQAAQLERGGREYLDDQGNPIGAAAQEEEPLAYGVGGPMMRVAMDVGGGIVKGLGKTAVGAGRMFHAIPGFSSGVDELWGLPPGASAGAMEDANAATVPSNTTEALAQGAEQAGEFVLLPGPAKVRGAARALELAKAGAAAAGLSKVQGATGGEAAVAGVMGAVPVVEGVQMAGRALKEWAPEAVRAAIKPTVSAMKRVAGASVEGIEAKATQLVNFILENRLTTAEKARDMISDAERELQRALAVKNAPTDAPRRAQRYLEALEKSAAKQGLPASDVAAIKNAQAQLLEGPMGKDVVTITTEAREPMVGFTARQPPPRIVATKSRALRDSMPATEALESARASSRWSTRKAWGEQKGAELEAQKAVERAQRDSVKAAVPEATEILQRQGKAIRAADALDRAEFRAANRDVVSLPAHVIAAGEIARGKVPVMAVAANWLRNNQLKAGVYADILAKAIERGDTGRVVSILHQFGVGASGQLLRPAPGS